MKHLLAAIFLLLSLGLPLHGQQKTPPPCLLVRPTEGFQTAFGRVGSKYEYLDSFNLPAPKMKYKQSELEKLQKQGVHVVVVPRDAVRNQIEQSRKSCDVQPATTTPDGGPGPDRP